MAREARQYDGELQMFREQARSINLDHLRFLRWLAEHGRLEHRVQGPPTGDLVADPMPEHPLARVA